MPNHPQTAAAPSFPPRGCGSPTDPTCCGYCGSPLGDRIAYCCRRCALADKGEV